MFRIIFINTYSLYSKNISQYKPGTDGFYQFGMSKFIAEELVKRNYPIQCEMWRMDLRTNQVIEKEIDSIHYKIFPSKKTKIKQLPEFSTLFIREILKLSKQREKVVIHFMGVHSMFYNIIAFIMRKHLIVATHLGGPNPLWKYENEDSKTALINYWIEKYLLLKPFDCFITISKKEADYFKSLSKKTEHMPCFGIPMLETLYIKDRKSSRLKLGLPDDKKILLQVGRAEGNRGFDWILRLIDFYKNKDDYYLIFVGINEEDEYYYELSKRKVFIKGYMSRFELLDYFNAADILYYLPNGKMDLEFAGISYVPLEALTCGTPVVATTLHHFPDDEINEVARIPRKYEDVIPMIEELLSLNVSRKKCREVVLKHFSWDKVIEKHWELYNSVRKH